MGGLIVFFIIIVCMFLLAIYVSTNADNISKNAGNIDNAKSDPNIHYTNANVKNDNSHKGVCSHCGASNPAPNTECEYCGSTLPKK